MKKLFLPLLAAIGMVAGFTLSSCGGGGGSSNSQADITGLFIKATGQTPGFSMSVDERLGNSNSYSVTYTFNENTVYIGTLSVYSGYPLLNEEGKAVIKAAMGIDDSKVTQEPAFIVWLGGHSNAVSVQLQSLIDLTITIDKNSDSGTMDRYVEATEFMPDNSNVKLPMDYPYPDLYIEGRNKLFKQLGKTPTTDEIE